MRAIHSGKVLARTQLQWSRATAITAMDFAVASLAGVQPTAFVSGFWRSGTTWLQEMLADATNSKTVFEPFSASGRWYRSELRRLLPGQTRGFYQAFMPGELLWPEVLPHMRRAMRGVCSSAFGLRVRGSLRDSARTTVIVKDVHSHFLLPKIHESFAVPVVHVRRHPGAVVSSFGRTGWGWNWDWPSISLAEVLRSAGLPELEPDYLEAARWADSSPTQIAKLGVYWAICEDWVTRATADQDWIRVIQYEDLITEPAASFDELLRYIGRGRTGDLDYDRPSATSSSGRQTLSVQQRRDDWRESLEEYEFQALKEGVAMVSQPLADRYF